jgi:hypothetical protein
MKLIIIGAAKLPHFAIGGMLFHFENIAISFPLNACLRRCELSGSSEGAVERDHRNAVSFV